MYDSTNKDILTIEQIKNTVVPIAKKYKAAEVYLFGSYARGEAREDSDLDFLIHTGTMRGMLQYMGFVLDLEDVFGCHVDVVTDGIEDQEFLNRIKKDEVLLYEAG